MGGYVECGESVHHGVMVTDVTSATLPWVFARWRGRHCFPSRAWTSLTCHKLLKPENKIELRPFLKPFSKGFKNEEDG